MAAAVAGAHLLDRVDHVLARDDPAEHRIAPALRRLRLEVQELVVGALMKNCAVAECGAEVRAIASV